MVVLEVKKVGLEHSVGAHVVYAVTCYVLLEVSPGDLELQLKFVIIVFVNAVRLEKVLIIL